MRFLAVAVVGATCSRLAAADPVPDPSPVIEPGLPDHVGLPDPDVHLEGGFGLDLGDVAMGSLNGYAGLHGLLGVRVDRLAVLGELDTMILGGDNASSGWSARGALEARMSLWRGTAVSWARHHRRIANVRAELWVEPGIGYEEATQSQAPMLQRPDCSFAIGYQETDHGQRGFSFGSYVALRVITAEAPAGEDRGREWGVMLTSGIVLGR